MFGITLQLLADQEIILHSNGTFSNLVDSNALIWRPKKCLHKGPSWQAGKQKKDKDRAAKESTLPC